MDEIEAVGGIENWKAGLDREKEWNNLTSISFEELEKTVHKWLLVEDPGIVKLICSVVIANRLNSNASWLFLVAPSGGGKTEFIKGLNKIEYIYPLSNLTPQTFMSGMRGKDASLLPQITNKILTFKDFTTILQSHPQAQAEILAQLREIYDGYFKKDFGTGARREWRGKIGFIAGVTSIIDQYHNVHKSLGERFLQYRLAQPDRMEVMERIEENTMRKDQMDDEIATAFARFVKGIEIPEEMPEIPADIKAKLRRVADFASAARSAVIRNPFSKEIEFVPDMEMTTRIYSQVYLMAIALMVVNKNHTLEEGDYKILFKLGFDSIHYLRRKVLELLREYKGWAKTETIAVKAGYSTPTINKYLEDLTVLGIAERMKPRNNLNIWRLNPKYRTLWKESEWVVSEAADGRLTDTVADEESVRGPGDEEESLLAEFQDYEN